VSEVKMREGWSAEFPRTADAPALISGGRTGGDHRFPFIGDDGFLFVFFAAFPGKESTIWIVR
jgi:hypothetical protein